ncbi:MAG: 5'-deoxynucleotidase [Chloroflexota bacterium]
MNHFFAYLYRLRFIQRWGLMRNTVPENAAEHSYYVALLTHALCLIARDTFHREVDVDRAVLLALYHDVGEVITGDIPSPVKHHSRVLGNMRELEALAADQLLSMVPDELLPAYRSLIRPDPAATPALAWVKAADKLAAYLKCSAEVAAGNREFTVAKRQLEGAIRSLEMPEIDYFLKHFAPSFEQTLDEISQ